MTKSFTNVSKMKLLHAIWLSQDTKTLWKLILGEQTEERYNGYYVDKGTFVFLNIITNGKIHMPELLEY